jgi:hypothetical protein
MEQGLQNLLMFRDNLQEPDMTAMDNLKNLDDLTKLSMLSGNYANMAFGGFIDNVVDPNPMMNAGLMSLPVAQAGFGGFIKRLTSIPRKIVKTVKRVAKSPLGRAAITVAPMFLGLPPVFANPALNAAFFSGTTSLLTGAKPEDALKTAILSGGLAGLTSPTGFKTPEGARSIFSKAPPQGSNIQSYTGSDRLSNIAGDTSAYYTPPQTNVRDLAAQQQLAGVGTTQNLGLTDAGVDIAANTYGDVAGTGLSPEFGVTPEQLASPSPAMSSYGGDITTAQYPGGTAPPPQTSAFDSIKSALRTGYDKFKSLPTYAKVGTGLLGAELLTSGMGEEVPGTGLTVGDFGSAGVNVQFDEGVATYINRATGQPISQAEALQMARGIQSGITGDTALAQATTAGADDRSTLGYDLRLSSSGGLIGMAYNGMIDDKMPENNMDVKYKEFSGMVGGRGSGMEDNVYMPIVERDNGHQVATLAVSPKEYVVDANTMSLLGNGNPDEGAEIMDKTVKDIRMAATGQTKQQKEIDGLASLDRMRRSV